MKSKAAMLVTDERAQSSAAVPAPVQWLSFEDIEREGNGYPKQSTLHVWKCTNRYGFRDIVTMVGGRPRVRRDRWEALLESRTLGGDAA